mmetsp:Transcript_32027/g.76519  ORF Transcript_32027/g.76519 Transcript_32027/m.76519 type:complete len:360 (-) Transcript_32027:1211-2290(-)
MATLVRRGGSSIPPAILSIRPMDDACDAVSLETNPSSWPSSPPSPSRTWFTTTLRTRIGMSGSPNVRSFSRRTLSLTASSVPIVTIRNSVADGSAKRSSRSYIDTWNLRSALFALSAASSRSALFDPAAPLISIFTAGFELSRRETTNTLSMRSARNDGVVSIRRVWPVGAVSSTTRSYVPRLMSCMTLARATTSSVPAGSVSMISPRELSVEEISDPPSPPSSRSLPMRRSTESRNSESAAVGSISIAESVPSSPPGKAPGAGGTPYSGTSVREPPLRSMSRASPRLWAGSVLTRATECPADASAMAREADVVVLPTPPLPPHTTSLGFLGASGPASAVSSKDTRRSNPPPANVRPPR